MRHSIKKQFSFIFIAILTGTILLCLLANMFFLKSYYVMNKKNAIIDSYKQINEAANANSLTSDTFMLQLRQICERYNISVIVMNQDMQILASLQSNDKMLKDQLISYFLYGVSSSDVLEQTPNYVLQVMHDFNTDTKYIEMWGKLDNGDRFMIRTALEGIEDSARIANRFLIYVGLIAIVTGVILIVYITRKITNPILNLAAISEKMAHLDFDAKYETKGDNEIDLLGKHINQLSDTLESTISELKTANNELKKDIEKKEQIDEMRKEFLSNVSHELKTPIALIQGYAEGLKEGITDDEESKNFYCDVIMDEANKMNIMVKNLLSLNELEFGNATIAMERFNINVLIKNYLQSMELFIKQGEIQVDYKEMDNTDVWADEFKIEEVIRNYFSNAMNHVKGNPKVISIRVEKMEQKMRISIYNSGDPIPEENLPYIWDKFYKVDKARTRAYGGSGVGLSIVKAIMEAHNQEYGVYNQTDGVTFWFEVSTL